MIGIEFEHESSYEKILYNLLDGIYLTNYKWYTVQQEVIFEMDYTSKLEYCMPGSAFQNIIHDVGNYYIYQLNLQAYPKYEQTNDNIETYSDFIKSKCEMIILFSDNSCVEIYAKSTELLKIIIQNLKNKNMAYEIKTLDTDHRRTMYI